MGTKGKYSRRRGDADKILDRGDGNGETGCLLVAIFK